MSPKNISWNVTEQKDGNGEWVIYLCVLMIKHGKDKSDTEMRWISAIRHSVQRFYEWSGFTLLHLALQPAEV